MPNLYTIGYEGSDVERLVQTLSNLKIQLLADVRELPLSRKKGLSKRALSARLAEVEIEYRHIRQLGDPKAGRDAARSGNYPLFEAIFSRHLALPETQQALTSLFEIAARKRACIMCFERCVSVCHRSFIADVALQKGFEVLHLVADQPEAYLQNDIQIPRHYPRKSVTAAE